MVETLTDFIESLGRPGEFTPGPIFQPEADILTVFFENAPHYAERIDKWLTIFKSFQKDALVGFELKGICHKAKEMIATLNPKPGQPTKVKVELECKPHINLLLTFYMKEPLGPSRKTYQRVYERARGISGLRVPDEVVAPCATS